MDEEYSGIGFCPVCCSNVDIIAKPGETVELECATCEQKWTMEVQPARFAQHSIS